MKILYDINVEDKNTIEVENAQFKIKLLKIQKVLNDMCNFNFNCNGNCDNCEYIHLKHEPEDLKGIKQIIDIINNKDEDF